MILKILSEVLQQRIRYIHEDGDRVSDIYFVLLAQVDLFLVKHLQT